MRLSVDKNDPGYRSDYRMFGVRLDGVEISHSMHAITADEEAGFVVGYEIGPNNLPAIERGEFRLKRMSGKVEIYGR